MIISGTDTPQQYQSDYVTKRHQKSATKVSSIKHSPKDTVRSEYIYFSIKQSQVVTLSI